LLARVALVVSLSFLALALIFEVYLRQAGFLEAQPANYPCIAGDPVLNHVFHPNCQAIASAVALKTAKDVTYKTNSLGYRGHEPARGKKTIVVIGDSYTEGFGLEENETFPSNLERALQDLGAADWQVLNGGTLGFTPALYAKYFDRFFLEIKPELVLLNLDLTDFSDEAYYLQTAEYDSRGFPVAFPGREIFPSWILGYVYSNRSALLRFLHQEANQWSLAGRREEIQPVMDQLIKKTPPLILQDDLKATGMEGCQKSIEAVAKSVFELKRRVESVGGQLVLHMYPPGHLVKQYAALPQNISFVRSWDQKKRRDFTWACGSGQKIVDVIRAMSNRNGILFVDSFPLIMSYPGKEALYFEKDAHWNEAGVKVVTSSVANQIFSLLKRKK